jgi:glucose/arabinose dehydrogenase
MSRRLPPVLATAGLVLLLGPQQPATAVTACSSAACSGSCSPAPAGIATLVPSTAFPSTDYDTPVAFVDPGDELHHRFIATQEGVILVWDGVSQTISPTPFLDLRADVAHPVLFGGERGLLSMAVEPDYPTTGRFYVYYTDSGGDIVISRYQRSAGNPDVADATPAVVLIVEHSSAGNHNGGSIAFGPDGFLYITTGDGGGGCDGNLGTGGDGQRQDTLLGKMLRIDVRGIDALATAPDSCGVVGANYTVPFNNPFQGQAPGASFCTEVWTMGLRNPFRFSFDRLTGDIYIGDVGQNNFEEVDLRVAGTTTADNFGWPCREACSTSAMGVSNCSIPGCPSDPGTTSCTFPRSAGLGGFYDSILCHTAGSGWHSVMGGYRYRGLHIPSLAGAYTYGDASCSQIWKTTTLNTADPAGITSACWASGVSGTYGFAEDHNAELYVVRGGAHQISCYHNGLGCYWAGFAGQQEDGFESGAPDHWSAAVQ